MVKSCAICGGLYDDGSEPRQTWAGAPCRCATPMPHPESYAPQRYHLSNLPQEVREALDKIRPDDGRPNSILHTQYVAWQTIHAELVRVTNELAALRARFDSAKVGTIVSGRANSFGGFHIEVAADMTWHSGQCVVVIDEGAAR